MNPDLPTPTVGRTIDTHIVNPCNDSIKITVMDEPGAGGAHHHYRLEWPQKDGSTGTLDIKFQNGPINECGVNGVTQEALYAIIHDRLECFQKGPFACRDNAVALTHSETALGWLFRRTLGRMRRGVEGTHKV